MATKKNKMLKKIFIYVTLISLGGSCSPSLPEDVANAYENLPKNIDYNQHVKPILSDKCFLCHGPDKAKISAGLQLHSEETAYAELPESPGKFAIDPGSLKNSEAFHRILSDDPNYIMPTPESHLKLTAREKAVLVKWIEDGAEYKDHWAFIAVENPKVPKVKQKDFVNNPIDNFIFSKLKENNLEPSKKADKELLLRRLSLDLTGLPPTPQEIKSFVNDNSKNAYEKQVDRLLASPHYGEKMSVDWLDLARYADTHGYLVDRYRDMSPWRDWVISAFNKNQKYDEFVTWQLAGDLMEDPTKEQILATGFNRLHPQNLEGGIIDEEYRSAYVADRTDVVGQGLMGLTVACAKCHDHKYDPVSQKEYYQMYSFFNQVNESGQIPWDWSIPVPTLLIPTEEEEKMIAYMEDLVKEETEKASQVTSAEVKKADEWIADAGYKSIPAKTIPNKLVAQIDFNNGKLQNKLNPRQKGKMRTQFADNQPIVFKKGVTGKGLQFDGDAWLDLDKIGVFQRSEPFSIALSVFIPKDLKEGVIFHKAQGTRLHSYRGYHLTIKPDNTLEFLLAHVWPDNAIVERSVETVPREEWVQFTMTYDGSSKAKGLKLYMNGKELESKVEVDNLYKDIIFHNYEDYIYKNPIEPGLQIGARWRGKGIGGAVVDDIYVFKKELAALEVNQLVPNNKIDALIAKEASQLNSKEKDELKAYYVSAKSKVADKALAELQEVRTRYVDSVDDIQEVMVMKDTPNLRKTYILERGQYDSYGEEVTANTPEIFPDMGDYPKNRLGLAKWLFNPEHPLTARVAVNRYWQNFFGQGLVKTAEDFGNQGSMPSHPELLDWLATQFVESGWDLKELNKLIVMSHTYQQDSKTSDELREVDPDNILLARGPAQRLSGEMLRDNALVASGMLNDEIGGESVKPYQPAGLWKMNNGKYEQDSGDNLYRRSLYTIWKRSAPNPTLATFDATTREVCTTRRQETNTPLQALVLLNDPTYLEAAKVLGKKMTTYDSIQSGIKAAYLKLTGKSISEDELNVLTQLQQEELKKFNNNKEKANGWLNSGDYKFSAEDNLPLIAANAVVASTIMNSDATITKR